MSEQRKWMLYPVESEQIRRAADDDADHAEVVIRVDGPTPGRPTQVVPESELSLSLAREQRLRSRLDAAYEVVAELSAPIGRIRLEHPGFDPDLAGDCVKRLRAVLSSVPDGERS